MHNFGIYRIRGSSNEDLFPAVNKNRITKNKLLKCGTLRLSLDFSCQINIDLPLLSFLPFDPKLKELKRNFTGSAHPLLARFRTRCCCSSSDVCAPQCRLRRPALPRYGLPPPLTGAHWRDPADGCSGRPLCWCYGTTNADGSPIAPGAYVAELSIRHFTRAAAANDLPAGRATESARDAERPGPTDRLLAPAGPFRG